MVIILVAILTNFDRMNGTDGWRERRGTRPTEAVKPIMAPRGFLLPSAHHLLSLHPSYTLLLQPNLYCPFLQLLLHQPLSALPNSAAPRSTLRLLFLELPPAAGGNHPPSITSIEAANISSLRPKFRPRFPTSTVAGACPCPSFTTHCSRVRTEGIPQRTKFQI